MTVAAAVDAALHGMAELLGSGSSPTPPSADSPTNPPAPPDWEGAASQRAQLLSTQLDDQRHTLYSAQQSAADIINEAGQISIEARTGINGVRADWERDKAAVGPFSNTPEGQAALAKAGQMRLNEADGVIRQAVSRFGQASQRLGAVTAGLPLSPAPNGPNAGAGTSRQPKGTIQAVGRGWKQDPTPPTPSTTSRAPLPECDLDEIAKLERKTKQWDTDWADFMRRAKDHNGKPTAYPDTPQGRNAYNDYQQEEAALKADKARLLETLDEIKREIKECGVKMIGHNGHEIVLQWPDGSTASIPDWPIGTH